MAVDDIVGAHIVGRYQSQNIVSTLHYKITAQTQTDHEILATLATAWDDAMTTAWLARHIDTYELVGIKFFSLTGGNKRPGIRSVGTFGAVVGVEVPSPVCRVITLYTDSTNYRRRGRVMLSGCDTTMFDDLDGSVTNAETLLLSTLAALFLDPLVSDDETAIPCIPPTDVLPVEPLTAVLVRKTPSLIRSRRVKGFSIG